MLLFLWPSNTNETDRVSDRVILSLLVYTVYMLASLDVVGPYVNWKTISCTGMDDSCFDGIIELET